MALRPKKFFWLQFRHLYNPVRRLLARPTVIQSDLPALLEIRDRAARPTDISDHLVPLFVETLNACPKLIVELGVRGGESTFVFERAAALLGASLISVDIEPCLSASKYPKWMFIQSDDIPFAAKFPHYCEERAINPVIDLLFIDTSHHYEHTKEEIKVWFPLLAENAKVIFHDTNMKAIYRHKDGTVAFGWDNGRGVIRAIEEYLGTTLNEDRDLIEIYNGWLVRHTATCSGLTILDRVGKASVPTEARELLTGALTSK